MFVKRSLAVFLVLLALTAAPHAKAEIYNPEDYLNIEFSNEGKKVKLADFKGKVVLLEFWAPWCKFCIRQMPAVEMLAEKYKDEPKFQILPVSIDYRGEDAVRTFYKTKGIDNLKVYTDETNFLARAFNARMIPSFFMLDKNGEVIKKVEGIQNFDEDLLEDEINK